MSDTNQAINGNLALNRTVDSSTPLNVRLATTAGVGSKLAAFGTSAAERIQFFDETSSLSRGAYMYFNNGNPSSIRSLGNLEFWPNNALTSSLSLSSAVVNFPLATGNTVLSLSSTKNLISTALTNGQLLIGSSSAAPVAANITGTSNQITVTNGAGYQHHKIFTQVQRQHLFQKLYHKQPIN